MPVAVERLAEQHGLSFCDVSGFGELKWLELTLDDGGSTVQRFEGPLHLISLCGRLRMVGAMSLCDFYCTFARQTDNGIQVLGGKLRQATATFAELTLIPLVPLESKGDLPIESAPSTREAPPRELIRASAPRSAPVVARPEDRPRLEVVDSFATSPQREVIRAPAALDDRWAKAVLESKRIEDDPAFFDEEETETRPKRGDIVMHAQFGECRVTRIDDDHITLRKPDGRNVQLGLTVLRFFSTGKHDGKNTFRVEIGKR